MPDDARLSCREASRLLSLAADRELEDAERKALEEHLSRCFACRNFGEQLQFIAKAAKRFRGG